MRRPVIYFIRHGETEWNAARRLQGRQDSALSVLGCEQVNRCGQLLRDLFAREGRAPADFDYVSSPLIRARSSMERVRTVLGLDPHGYRTDERLAEIAFGEWEGLSFADLKSNAADLLALREQDPWNFVPPGGESYVQLLARVRHWHGSLTGDTVVASHLNTGRALMAHLGIAPQAGAPRSRIDHAVVYIFDESGLTRHGGVSHLTP
jgi:broad specificity phosphatase PhoE